MGLFRPRIRLTKTSYGYLPPSGAVVWGWRCSNQDCNKAGDEVPRRGWPYPCPACAAGTDPAFVDPWKHEARGFEIRHLLATGIEDGGYTENDLYMWRYQEALRIGDAAEARKVRAEFRDARDAEDDGGGLLLGIGYFTLVQASLAAGDLDAAAEDLLDWFDRTDGTEIEANAIRRSACRQIVTCAIEFMDAPDAAEHVATAQVRKRCLELAEAAYQGLLPEQQNRVVEMGRAA